MLGNLVSEWFQIAQWALAQLENTCGRDSFGARFKSYM